MPVMRIDHTDGPIGSWFLQRLLGEGTRGDVHAAANQSAAGRLAAIKMLQLQPALDAELMRYLGEAGPAAAQGSIVQVLEGGVTIDGVSCLMTALLPGETLDVLLTRGPLSVQQTLHIGEQAADALQAAHQHGIVHRALTPGNILLVPHEGRPDHVGILDFGVARLAAARDTHYLGTPAYLSPEQWSGAAEIDGRTDIYSLGLILYECLAGRHPFAGNTPSEWLDAHLHQAVPELAAQAPVSPALRQLVHSMLAKQREDRPQTMAAVLRGLQTCATGYGELATVNRSPLPTVRLLPGAKERRSAARTWRTHTPVLAGAVLVGCALAAGFWVLMSQERVISHEPQPSPGALPAAPPGPTPSALPGAAQPSSPSPTLPPEMVVFGPGEFMMGRGSLADHPESPTRLVTVGRFALSRFEVSMGEFRDYTRQVEFHGPLPWEGVEDFDAISSLPVNLVNRDQASAYCRWKYAPWGGRLPTEGEWEYAARDGQSARFYPWKDDKMLPDRVNAGRWQPMLMPIDSLASGATERGLLHMLGNVAEWTQHPTVPYPGRPGRVTGEAVVRGGGADTSLRGLSATFRVALNAEHRDPFVGFRCAAEVPK